MLSPVANKTYSSATRMGDQSEEGTYGVPRLFTDTTEHEDISVHSSGTAMVRTVQSSPVSLRLSYKVEGTCVCENVCMQAELYAAPEVACSSSTLPIRNHTLLSSPLPAYAAYTRPASAECNLSLSLATGCIRSETRTRVHKQGCTQKKQCPLQCFAC